MGSRGMNKESARTCGACGLDRACYCGFAEKLRDELRAEQPTDEEGE